MVDGAIIGGNGICRMQPFNKADKTVSFLTNFTIATIGGTKDLYLYYYNKNSNTYLVYQFSKNLGSFRADN